MTPEQLKSIRLDLGLTQSEFGRVLGLSGADPSRTVRLWEAGSRPISGPVQLCLAYIVKFGLI